VFGLATPDNYTLYAVAGQNLYTANLTTGAATFGVSWAGDPQGLGQAFGEAFSTESGAGSVPEPTTFALSAAGIVLLVVGLRRRSHSI
jgi:hypothetical protein